MVLGLRLNQVLLLVLLLVLGLLGFDYYIERSSNDDLKWLLLNDDINYHIVEAALDSDVFIEHGLGDAQLAHVGEHLDRSRQMLDAVLQGGYIDGDYIDPIAGGEIRNSFSRLFKEIKQWQLSLAASDSMAAVKALAPVSGQTVLLSSEINSRLIERIKSQQFTSSILLIITLFGIAFITFATVLFFRTASKKLQKQNAQLTHALSQIDAQKYALDQHSIVAVTDLNGKIVEVNDKFCTASEYSREELIGANHSIINSGLHSQEFFKDLWLTITRGEVWRGDVRNRSKSGRLYWVNTTIVPYLDDDGKPERYVAIRTDITQRVEAEARNKLLAAAVDQSTMGMLLCRANGEIEYANQSYLEIMETSLEKVVNVHVGKEGVISNDPEFNKLLSTQIELGVAWSSRCKNRRQNGQVFEQALTITPIKNDQNRVDNFVLAIRDITKELQFEEQVNQSQKMQAVGTLAGGIAHDFNNILSAIIGYTDLTLEDLPQGSLAAENLYQVMNAASRAKELVQQILAFSRQSEVDVQSLSPVSLTKEVVKLVRSTIPPMIRIDEHIEMMDGKIRIDASQYYQMVMNLLVNASHAIGETSGLIELCLEQKYLDGQQGQAAELPVGDYMVLSIKDSGCGMPEEIRKRIFEPFFTTKPVDKGTGMGLAAVHGIVSGVGGEIYVSSEEGNGSRFDVFIPLAKDVSGDAGDHGDSWRQGSERILLVDDEELQTQLLTTMLSRQGYRVTAVNSGVEALGMFKKFPNEFDLVISDYNMPKMTGEMLAKQIKMVRADIPIIICTGVDRFSEENAVAAGVTEVIRKPVTLRGLDRTLTHLFME